MAERIHYSDLEHLLADDNTPDEVLAEYIKPAPLRALPLAPVMTIDDSKVEVPPNRGIIGLSVKSLNERANRRRLAAYQAKIDGGWKGLKLLAQQLTGVGSAARPPASSGTDRAAAAGEGGSGA